MYNVSCGEFLPSEFVYDGKFKEVKQSDLTERPFKFMHGPDGKFTEETSRAREQGRFGLKGCRI